jgi:hypothetical protein
MMTGFDDMWNQTNQGGFVLAYLVALLTLFRFYYKLKMMDKLIIISE